MKPVTQRARGILMHVSSLPGEYGCGSFGSAAVAFIDLLADCGYTYWQTLPFGVPDKDGSPYKSFSAFAGNPLFIDLQTLYREDLLTANELKAEAERCAQMQYRCNFSELTAKRYALLRTAALRVRDKAAVERFIAEQPRLAEFCAFMTEFHPTAPTESEADRADERFFWMFTQYAFFHPVEAHPHLRPYARRADHR
jgi:4-alpha-glucanotransferase